MNAHIKFKNDQIKERYQFLHETVKEILDDMAEWCERRNIPLILTETVTTSQEDRDCKRVSDSHCTARAVDISIRTWGELIIKQFTETFNDRFTHVAAIAKLAAKPQLVVRHNSGRGDHLHVQIGKLYSVKDPMKGNKSASSTA